MARPRQGNRKENAERQNIAGRAVGVGETVTRMTAVGRFGVGLANAGLLVMDGKRVGETVGETVGENVTDGKGVGEINLPPKNGPAGVEDGVQVTEAGGALVGVGKGSTKRGRHPVESDRNR